MSDTTLKDLVPFWDYKLTLFWATVFLTLIYWSYWKVIPVDDESVHRQSGTFDSVASCTGGMNSKSIMMEDKNGRFVSWAKKTCDENDISHLIGKQYIAYFSEKRNKNEPIYLEVEGDLYFEPGVNRRDVFAIIAIGFIICFFTSIPILHKRRNRFLNERNADNQ